ncbi:hypothetical protein CDIK_2643 [Cucumispora dikerogammari]|nr:hypothetical protein CDIK_2643 [Cucumispora dikerogammari]
MVVPIIDQNSNMSDDIIEEQAQQRAQDIITDDSRLNLLRAVCDNGMKIKTAAETFNIKYGTARNIISAFKKIGKLKKNKKGGSDRTKLLPDTLNKIEALISENPSLTLKELQSKSIESENPGFSISISTIERGLSELRITLKLVHR